MSRADPPFIPPIPSQPLPYSIPVRTGRPGIITAIGVTCIVIACLSALSSFISGTNSVGFYMMSRVSAQMASMSATMASASANAGPATMPGSSPVLPGGDAGVAVNAIDSMLSLDSQHLRELDRLMRRHGRLVFGGDDDTPLTAAAVRQAVISSKRNGGISGFSTSQGTVDIFADHATFTSADGSTTVTTSARRNQDQTTQSTPNGLTMSTVAVNATAAPSSTLTTAQIDQAVALAQGMVPKPNAAQLRSLRAELSKPNQPLATVGGSSPVTATTQQPNGNLSIYFDTGNALIVDPRGKVLSSGTLPMLNLGISGGLATVDALEGLASIGLAIYLLIVGILVLRGSFASPRMLRIYAWIKIPLALIAGIGLTMLGYALSRAIMNNPAMGAASSSADSARVGFTIGGGLAILFGLAFPVALLIALRSKTVSEYYNAVVSDT